MRHDHRDRLADVDRKLIDEANARQAGPKLQQQLMKYFRCDFGELFQVVLVDPETSQETILIPRGSR
jgi:hypothetical protein